MSRNVSVEQMADAIMEDLREYADAAAMDVVRRADKLMYANKRKRKAARG